MPYLDNARAGTAATPIDFNKAFTDFDGWRDSLPELQKQAIDSRFKFTPPDQLDAERKRFLSVGYVAHSTGQDVENVSKNFENYFMPGFARHEEGLNLSPADQPQDVGGFFERVKGHLQAKQDESVIRDEAMNDAYLAAVDGDNMATALSNWQQQASKKTGFKASHTSDYMAAYNKVASVIEPRREKITAFVDALQRDMQGTPKEGDSATMQSVRDDLLDMSDNERRLVLNAIREKATKAGKSGEDKSGVTGFVQQMGEGLARFVTSDTSFSENGLAEVLDRPGKVQTNVAKITTPEEARAFVEEQANRNRSQAFSAITSSGTGGIPMIAPAGPEREMTESEAELVKQAKARAQKAIDMGREIRQMAQSTDPVGTIAGSLGTSLGLMAITIGTGGATLPVTAQLYAANDYDQIRLEHPDIAPGTARKIALVSGVGEAALDALDIKILGRMPNVSSLLRGGWRQGAIQSAKNLGESMVAENLQEAAQDAVLPLVTALSSDAPSVNWRQDLYDYAAGRADVAISILPLVLVGSGIATVHEIRAANQAWTNEQALRAAGFAEKDRAVIHDAAQTGNSEVLQTAIREAMPRRSPEIAAEYAGDKAGNRVAAEMAMDQAAESQKLGLLPTIRRDSQGWLLSYPGAEPIRVQDRAEAEQVALAHLDALDRQSSQAMAQVADEFIKLGGNRSNEAVEISPESRGLKDEVAVGRATEEEAARAAELHGQIYGLTPEESKAVNLQVLGNNKAEMIENVRTHVSRIFGGGNVATVMHEGIHWRWRQGLESGHYTHEQGLTWVRMAEQAAGFSLLPENDADVTPAQLDEAITETAVADLIGKRKDGSHFTPGLISRGLASQALSQRADAKERGMFRQWLQSWKAFWGQVFKRAKQLQKARADGKLGEDFDAFLDDLMGADAQARHEGGAVKEVQALAGEIDAPFSLKSRAIPADASKVTELPDGAKLIGPTSFSIRAYHGTPHKVDKFSLGKIGTGEGAQAYGWGLYFAEKKAVADSYKSAGADAKSVDVWQQPNGLWAVFRANSEIIARDLTTRAKAEDVAAKERGGNLYTVELLPDESEFLDWDRPLSEQSEKVKKALLDLQHGKVNPDGLDMGGGSVIRDNRRWQVKPGSPAPWVLVSGSAKFDLSQKDVDRMLADSADLTGNQAYTRLTAQKGSQKSATEYLASLGIPGIKYLDGGSRGAGDGTRNFVIFDEKLVKILEENGKPVEQASFSLRPVTPAQDAEYLDAVNRGDMETAQRMVDEAAKAAMPDSVAIQPMLSSKERAADKPLLKLYHGTKENFNVFERGRKGVTDFGWLGVVESDRHGIFFAENRDFAETFAKSKGGSRVVGAFLNITNPFSLQDAESILYARDIGGDFTEDTQMARWFKSLPDQWEAFDGDNGAAFTKWLSSKGYDGALIQEAGVGLADEPTQDVWVALNPSQIKSADPITRDADGNAIPLSQRFNEANDDIRFSLAPRNLTTIADTQLAAKMKKPEFKEAFYTVARERLAKMRDADQLAVDNTRTAKSLGKESKMREALRRDELVNAGLDALEPATRLDYENGLQAVEDHPLIKRMLGDHGKLMSRTEARKSGKLLEGEYDDAPWIPSSWYGGKITPDVMANNLGFQYASEMWAALGNVVESVAKQNDRFKAANEVVKDIVAQSTAQAKTETAAWLKAAEKAVPSPKERQMQSLRMLDAILSAFPAEVRGKVGGFVKLASLGTDDSRAKEITRRIDKLEEVLEDHARKHFGEKIEKLFEKAAPKDKGGKAPKGKLGADVHALVSYAEAVGAMSGSELVGETAKLSDEIEKAEAAGDMAKVATLQERQLVSDIMGNLADMDSAELAAAHEWLADTIGNGRLAWKAHEETRLDEIRLAQSEAKADIGTDGLASEAQRQLAEAAKSPRKEENKGLVRSIWSFEQTMRHVLGQNSKLAARLVAMARKATNSKTDAITAKRQQFRDMMRTVFNTKKTLEWQRGLYELQDINGALAVSATITEGSNVKDYEWSADDVRIALKDPAHASTLGLTKKELAKLQKEWDINESLPSKLKRQTFTVEREEGKPVTSEVKLSQLQALHLSMMNRQAKYQPVLEHWGWTPAVMLEVEKQLTNESKAIRAWLANEYSTGYDSLNEVFARMYGVNLPRLVNYAPGTFEGKDMMSVDANPFGDSMIPEGGMKAGMLKKRVVHKAKPRLEDALSVFWGHIGATEHFKHFAEFTRELRGTMNDAKVRAAIDSKGGKGLLETVQGWLTAFEKNGVQQREFTGWANKLIQRWASAKAYSALAFNFGTLLKQMPAALNSFAEVPFGEYAPRFAKALTGQLDFATVYNAPVIRRRIEAGMNPEARQAMAGMWSDKPTLRRAALEWGMEKIAEADAMFSTFSAAIAYDYYLTEAGKMSVDEATAKAIAMEQTEKIVAKTSQPIEMMDRSLFELGLSPMAKLGFMFQSEARQKAAYWIEAVMPSSGLNKGERARRIVLLHVLTPLLLQTLSNAWRDARDDNDDDVFDERNWTVKGYLAAMALGPLSGLPLAGSFLGNSYGDMGVIGQLWTAEKDFKSLFTDNTKEPWEKAMRATTSTLRAIGQALGGDWAALGASANIIRDLFGLVDNAEGKDR